MRVCSLLPSATEILYALGLGESIVGVTHECDFPPDAKSKPALIRPRVDPNVDAAEVDRQVRELVDKGESIYAVDAELLESLSPDLIITQDLCHVCAASPEDLASALSRMACQPKILSLTPHSLADVWYDILRIGDATGTWECADEFASSLTKRVAAVESAARRAGQVKPRVLCLEWLEPYYVAGHWVPEMVEKAGGVDVFGRSGGISYRVTSQQIADCEADILLVMPCGYDVARTAREFRASGLSNQWRELPAVCSGQVFAVDANAYFSRSGPRLADGVELLAQIFHGDVFSKKFSAADFLRI
jgi:iron complex transport system substrate-binding protein